VAGRPMSVSLRDAQMHGYDVFVTDQAKDGSAACRCTGVIGRFEDLLDQSDVLLDCTPSGVPRERVAFYDRYPQLVVIVQGERNTRLEVFPSTRSPITRRRLASGAFASSAVARPALRASCSPWTRRRPAARFHGPVTPCGRSRKAEQDAL